MRALLIMLPFHAYLSISSQSALLKKTILGSLTNFDSWLFSIFCQNYFPTCESINLKGFMYDGLYYPS